MYGVESSPIQVPYWYGVLQKTAIASGTCILLITAFASWSPPDLRPTMNIGVGWEHIAAFGLLGGCWSFAFPRRAVQLMVAIALVAIVLEAGQIMVPGRHGRLIDVATKIAGGAGGIVFGHALGRLARSRVLEGWW